MNDFCSMVFQNKRYLKKGQKSINLSTIPLKKWVTAHFKRLGSGLPKKHPYKN